VASIAGVEAYAASVEHHSARRVNYALVDRDLQELDGQVPWQWRDILPSLTSRTIEAAYEGQMNCFRSRSP